MFQIAGYGLPISIHALREERDPGRDKAICRIIPFQSTRSARSATSGHRPACRCPCKISIHALREERDVMSSWQDFFNIHFNPRAPRGARR